MLWDKWQPTFLVCYEMLYYDICHIISEGISVFKETMNSAENELVIGYSPILTSYCLQSQALNRLVPVQK